MDTMGALALATEAPTDDLMDRTPIGRKEPLITNIMWRNIFGQAVFQITILLVLTYHGIAILGLKGTHDDQVLERNTIIFNAFVFCQVFNEINARRPDSFNVFQGIHKNYLFLAIIAITVFFQVIIVTFLNNFANTTMLAIKWWGLCIAIGAIALPLAVLIKCVPVPRKPLLEISCFPSKACLWLKRRRRPNPYDTDGEFEASSTPGSSRRAIGSGRDFSNPRLRSGRVQETSEINMITVQ